MHSHWGYLAIAILLEVAGTSAMKLSDGFTHLLPSILLFVCYGLAFFFLIKAVERLNLSTAYAIWAGVGTAIIALISVLLFDEPMSQLSVFGLILVIIGVILIKCTPQKQAEGTK